MIRKSKMNRFSTGNSTELEISVVQHWRLVTVTDEMIDINDNRKTEAMAEVSQKKQDQEAKKKPKRFPNKNYAVKKRVPTRPVDGDNVIFITKKTSFKAQLDKCCDLITKGEKEIILHGLGAAIQRCCNLALQLEVLFSGTVQIEVNTGSVDVVDDLEPLTDDLEFGAQVRQSSSIHIRLFRTAMLGANQ